MINTKIIKPTAIYLIIFITTYTVFNWYKSPKLPPNPSWQMTSLDGQAVDIGNMSKDRAVLVYFWGSWCHICRTTSPTVNQFSFNNQVVSIAVSSGDDGEMRDYLTQKNYRFNTINDNDGVIFHAFHGQVTPSYVIVKNGKVVQSFVGVQPLWALNLRMKIANL